jgi:hypothetical protein
MFVPRRFDSLNLIFAERFAEIDPRNLSATGWRKRDDGKAKSSLGERSVLHERSFRDIVPCVESLTRNIESLKMPGPRNRCGAIAAVIRSMQMSRQNKALLQRGDSRPRRTVSPHAHGQPPVCKL